MTPPPGTAKRQDRDFLIGVILSAWWLHSAHGEDSYATDLLLETVGAHGIGEAQRIAKREEYHFKRGFWSSLRRRGNRNA